MHDKIHICLVLSPQLAAFTAKGLVLTSALSFDLDQRGAGEHVMLALRKTEGIRAMFTKVPV
jgi:hypothetical protein